MRRISVVLATMLFIVYGLVAEPVRAASPDRVPGVINDDFETGEMDAWEAYPYAQDIGYEPFTIPQKEPTHNGSRYALAKIQRPNDVVELYEGFTKQIDLWTTGDTRMKLALFLTSDRKPETVEFSICLLDGRRYIYYLKSPDVNRWLEPDIPLRSFTMNGKPLESGQHIQAVTIMASYSVVSHLPSYTISLDDFFLNGERQRRFVTLDPSSTTFELYGYSILNRHFYYGDSIEMTVKPEDAPGKSEAKSVTCSLVDPSGRTVVKGVKLKESGGAWAATKAYTFRKNDPRGQWTITFTGNDASGNDIEWGFRFLMPGNRLTPSDHPRLYFTREELEKKLATQSPRERQLLDGFLAKPERFKDLDLSGIREPENLSTEALTGTPFSKVSGISWSSAMNRLASTIESGALLYAFTGDETAGMKAREALLRLCAFTMWNHPWQEAHGNHIYYPVGYVIGPVGIGYDLLYPLLSEEDKRAVRDGLMGKGIKQFYRDMVEMNRMPSSVTNHIAVIVSNLAVAATAIYGEDPANPSLEPYLSGILAKMKLFIDRTYYPDGGYGEPIGYENMATRDLVEALFVLERNFGIDYTTTTNVKELYRYPLFGAYNNGSMPEYGDDGIHSGWSWGGNPLLWLTYRTKNPWTAYFVQPTLEEGRSDLYKYLWYTTGLETKNREELIPSHHFPVRGTMFLRSDWSDEGSILVFKSGPNSNHYHVDQGSMILWTNGEILLSEAGLEGVKDFHGYYGNLYYPCYDTQPIGHNVMLVDSDPESQIPADYENGVAALRNYPRILHSFAGWNVDEVEGDLTCVYKGKLSRYTRSLLFMKPDMLFLFDRVTSPEGHSYSWLFHAEDTDGKPSISLDENHVRVTRPKARLDMDILSPHLASGRVRPSARDESFIQLTSEDGLTEAGFLAVMVPTAVRDQSAPEKKIQSSLQTSQGWTGAKVERETSTIMTFFRTGEGGNSPMDNFTTDAERFSVTTDEQGSVTGFFIRGTSFDGGFASFRSGGIPVSASVVYKPGGNDIEVDAPEGTDISVGMAASPATVTVNDKAVKGWKYDSSAHMLRISLAAGHSVVRVR